MLACAPQRRPNSHQSACLPCRCNDVGCHKLPLRKLLNHLTWQIRLLITTLPRTQDQAMFISTMQPVGPECRLCACACSQRIVPSHVHASGSNAQASSPADLPLRQTLRKSQGAYEPRIHDITEKFTKASSGMCYPSLRDLMSRGNVESAVKSQHVLDMSDSSPDVHIGRQ
jgi:hypothetical protein